MGSGRQLMNTADFSLLSKQTAEMKVYGDKFDFAYTSQNNHGVLKDYLANLRM